MADADQRTKAANRAYPVSVEEKARLVRIGTLNQDSILRVQKRQKARRITPKFQEPK